MGAGGALFAGAADGDVEGTGRASLAGVCFPMGAAMGGVTVGLGAGAGRGIGATADAAVGAAAIGCAAGAVRGDAEGGASLVAFGPLLPLYFIANTLPPTPSKATTATRGTSARIFDARGAVTLCAGSGSFETGCAVVPPAILPGPVEGAP